MKSFSPWNNSQNCSSFTSFRSMSSFSPSHLQQHLYQEIATTSENFTSRPRSMASSATEARNTYIFLRCRRNLESRLKALICFYLRISSSPMMSFSLLSTSLLGSWFLTLLGWLEFLLPEAVSLDQLPVETTLLLLIDHIVSVVIDVPMFLDLFRIHDHVGLEVKLGGVERDVLALLHCVLQVFPRNS